MIYPQVIKSGEILWKFSAFWKFIAGGFSALIFGSGRNGLVEIPSTIRWLARRQEQVNPTCCGLFPLS
jgi:hypothetical protein